MTINLIGHQIGPHWTIRLSHMTVSYLGGDQIKKGIRLLIFLMVAASSIVPWWLPNWSGSGPRTGRLYWRGLFIGLTCLVYVIWEIRVARMRRVDWGYEGPGGPQHWGSLSKRYENCSKGKQQSPIDITGYVRGDYTPISFLYAFEARTVRNDGKFVHVEYPPGNTLSVGERTYRLESAHIHTPSEHLVDGLRYAAELHLVHADDRGDLAVVGQLFQLGEPSPAVQAILEVAPVSGDEIGEGFTLNARSFRPDGPFYFRYDGSKTTPPCEEPVDWFVMRRPKTISPEQVEGLQALSGGPNSRPVQPMGGRVVSIVM